MRVGISVCADIQEYTGTGAVGNTPFQSCSKLGGQIKGVSCYCTLPETNIAPENGWLKDEFSFWDAIFSGAFAVSFREGNTVAIELVVTMDHQQLAGPGVSL